MERVKYFKPSIIRLLCNNPGPFTLQGSNIYLIGNREGRTLIDTGGGDIGDIEMVLEILEKEKAFISRVLITHSHDDHIGGLPSILQNFPSATVHIHKNFLSNLSFNTEKIENNEIFEIDEELKIEAIYSPGHLDDHIVYFERENGILFTGDIALGHGSSIVNNVTQYLNSMNFIMANLKVTALHCGHGESIVGEVESTSHLKKNYAHRLDRESQIISALSNCSTIEEVLNQVYKGIPPEVVKGAMLNIRVHCERLAEFDDLEIKEKAKLILSASLDSDLQFEECGCK